MEQRPIAERLFRWPSEDPRLIGSRCAQCEAITFPVSLGCPRCGSDALTDEDLPAHGTLWAWTTQGFLPKPPYAGPETASTFTPWIAGFVELSDTLRVESRIVGVGQDEVHIGMPLSLVVVPFTTDAEGRQVLTYAFEPATQGG